MGITLIVVGVLLAIIGVVVVSGGKNAAEKIPGETVVSVTEIRAKRQTANSPFKSYGYTALSGNNKDVAKNIQCSSTPTETSSMKNEESNKILESLKPVTEPTPQDKSQKTDGKAKTSKERGDEFEDFTVNLLADWRMKLLRRTQDKMSSGGVVAESCKEPDLHIEQKRGNSKVDYHLECKYRSRWTDNTVTFEDWQIKRYREFQKAHKRKVLIALGVGGTPGKPQTFMIVPIDSIKDNAIRKVDVSKYAVSPTSDGLAEYIDHYFDEVFASARRKHKE